MLSQARKRPASRPPNKVKSISVRAWEKGYQSTTDSNRTPTDGLKTALNVILKQDGTIGPRPGLALYGPQPVGTVLGEIVEFTKRSGSTVTNYFISMQVVAGAAKVYYARGEDTTWTLAGGSKTYNITKRAHFCPMRDIDSSYNDEDKVLVLNGEDTLSYFDINTFTIVTFTALSAVTAPTIAVGAGITGAANFTNLYRVTAALRGETAASASVSGSTTIPRSEWSGATQNIKLTITRVTNAKRYNIYYGTQAGSECYIGSVDDPGSGTTVDFLDSGAIDPDIFHPAPLGDSTAGPIGTRASFINGQVFIVGDKTNPKYVRYGGTGANKLDFSPYGGGGYVVVGGNKEAPVNVKPFRKNDGSPGITVLCNGTNGAGKRYIMSPATIGNTNYFAVSEENGNDGTGAPDSVVLAEDKLWYMSRDGVKSTMTKAQLQTILTTDGQSDKIKGDIKRLNSLSLEYSWGLYWENRIYWGIAAGSATNNQIWSLDLDPTRAGAWMLPWEVAADWGFLYNDNQGSSHFCVLVGNAILEFSESVACKDNGVAFRTGIGSGIIGFSENFLEWAKVIRVLFVVQRPVGTITATVTGKTEDKPVSAIGSQPFTAQTDVAGWGEAAWGARAWGETTVAPSFFGVERTEIEVPVDEELNWLSYDVNTNTAGTSFELTDVIIEYIPTGIKR